MDSAACSSAAVVLSGGGPVAINAITHDFLESRVGPLIARMKTKKINFPAVFQNI
jgi:hypothetical protein